MTKLPLLIKSIRQKDNFAFTVEWSDRQTKDYRLSEIQKHCPCAKCLESKIKPHVDEDVRAVRIANVGLYALQVKFTSGCSNGIYSYATLYGMGK